MRCHFCIVDKYDFSMALFLVHYQIISLISLIRATELFRTRFTVFLKRIYISKFSHYSTAQVNSKFMVCSIYISVSLMVPSFVANAANKILAACVSTWIFSHCNSFVTYVIKHWNNNNTQYETPPIFCFMIVCKACYSLD